MPDTFFRTIICGAAVAAVGAGVFIAATSKSAPDQGGKDLSTPITSTVTAHTRAGDLSASASSLAARVASVADPSRDKAQLQPALGSGQTLANASQQRGQLFAQGEQFSPADNALADSPVIHVGKDAIELAVPVNPQSGQLAQMPVALALALDPAGLPPQMQEAAQAMAMDFIENVAEVAAVAQSPQSADYYQRWQDAAFRSNRDFRMRYGRVAYVQMDLLLGQEAAAGIR